MLYEYMIISDVNEQHYGIAVFKDNAIVDAVSCVSDDKDIVCNLVKLCNALQLDPVHLNDVVLDALV